MAEELTNWKTQIRKGYLELCILLLIQRSERIYGFQLLEELMQAGLPVKEGTIYPLLNRMTTDEFLSSKWETESAKGHPRKFYSLTAQGRRALEEMKTEFEELISIYTKIQKPQETTHEPKPTT